MLNDSAAWWIRLATVFESYRMGNATYLLVTAKHDKPTATWLSSVWSTQRPERDRTTAVLREPTLELTLCGVVREPTKVQHFRMFAEKGSHITTRVEGASEDVWVSGWVGLAGARL